MDNNKYLFLITGAAGAGKSTLAQKIQEVGSKYIDPIAEICEADEFWYILGKGKYAFDPKLLGRHTSGVRTMQEGSCPMERT